MNQVGNFSNYFSSSPFLQDIPKEERESAQIVLFVVAAAKYQIAGDSVIIRQIDLSNVKKVDKLNQYRTEHRLIVAIEKGNQIYFNISQKIADELANKKQNLTVDGKEIKQIKIIDQTEYLDELSKVTEAIQQTLEMNAKAMEGNRKELPTHQTHKAPLLMQQLDDFILKMLLKIGGMPDKFKNRFLKRMHENQREIEQEKKKKEEKDRIKVLDIKDREIERSILKGEITKDEIKKNIKLHNSH